MSFWKPHKYHAKKVSHAGYSFGSKLEASVFDLLNLMIATGEYKDLEIQPHVKMTRAKILFIPDFAMTDVATGKKVYIEAKGVETPVYRIKRRLWEAGYGPGMLHVYRGSYKNPKLFETITPKEITNGDSEFEGDSGTGPKRRRASRAPRRG